MGSLLVFCVKIDQANDEYDVASAQQKEEMRRRRFYQGLFAQIFEFGSQIGLSLIMFWLSRAEVEIEQEDVGEGSQVCQAEKEFEISFGINESKDERLEDDADEGLRSKPKK